MNLQLNEKRVDYAGYRPVLAGAGVAIMIETRHTSPDWLEFAEAAAEPVLIFPKADGLEVHLNEAQFEKIGGSRRLIMTVAGDLGIISDPSPNGSLGTAMSKAVALAGAIHMALFLQFHR